MLKSLNISSFAVIDHLQVDFAPGLNVLTGETGSGKSIIVDALSLLLGSRSSSAQIRTGEAQAFVEGVFNFEGAIQQGIREILVELDLDKSSNLKIRREIFATGKNRAFINEKSVPVGLLKRLQPFIAEIYGQGEQRSLLSAQSHRELLDHFGGCTSLKNEVRSVFKRLRSVDRELKALVDSAVERDRSIDFIQHQLAEINTINPQSGEDERLLAERKVLVNAEKIIELGSNVYHNLYENDESVLARLTLIRRQLDELAGFIGNTGVAMDSLLSGIASLTDVADALRQYGADVEYSPTRLIDIEARLSELEKLKRKYSTDLNGILKVRDELSTRLSVAIDSAEHITTLKRELESVRQEYIQISQRLTACRRSSVPALEQKVREGLRHMAMEQAKFIVSIETSTLEDDNTTEQIEIAESAGELSGSAFFTQSGADYVEFLLSANPGESPRPLSYVASGGELSRLMLALRSISQESELIETIVFDEVDVGIGGRVAEAVGKLLRSLSATRQVFCVTHQAQIAKFADHHFLVMKTFQGERTKTNIARLTQKERIVEVSRMIGGNEKVETTREAAQWLLENAKSSRRNRRK